MNIGSVEGTGVFKVRPESLRMVKTNNSDLLMSESILAEGIGMSAVVVFWDSII